MKLFNIIFTVTANDEKKYVHSALYRSESIENAKSRALVDAEYIRESNDYVAVSTNVIEWEWQSVRDLLDGKQLPKTKEEADWPEILMDAKDYRKLASAKRVEAGMEVTSPSGAVWLLREPPIQQFVMSGKMPAGLAAKLAKAASEGTGDPEQVMKSFTPEDLLSNFEFSRDLLFFCAMEPRISLDPTDENALAPEDILSEDFTFLLNWIVTHGNAPGAQ